jgi:small GTP-binding protein
MTNAHSLSNPFFLTNQSKTKTLLIFGTCCTGKTALLLQLTKNRFDEEYQTTIGVNYYFKELSLVAFSIWDTRGTEISENFLPKHLFTSAHCFIIVLSYSDIESLNEAISYIDFIKSQTNCDYQRTSLNNNKPIIALINKKDVKDKQFKRIEAVVALRDVCPNILIGEITAKDNLMVKKFFEKVESLLVFGRINNNRGEEYDENENENNNEDGEGDNLLMLASTFKINDDKVSDLNTNISRKSVHKKKKKCCN